MNHATNHSIEGVRPAHGQRILIVEDNRAIASALRIVLQHEGYETRWCEDESIYGVIDEWKPELILMDLKMPHLDGCDATTAIKTDPHTQAIPVIVVTAENVTRERLTAMHANDLLTKPFPVPRLLERVAFWMSHPDEPPSAMSSNGCASGAPGGVDALPSGMQTHATFVPQPIVVASRA